jgi:hypothetical protein
MQMRDSKPSPTRSKTLATWLAIIGGSLGIHRFYLHGFRDLPGWLHPLPTVIGFFGVLRVRSLGQDDQIAWLLMPWLGCSISAAMLAAIIYGLMPDEKWNARFNVEAPESRSGWGAVLGAMLALLVGALLPAMTSLFIYSLVDGLLRQAHHRRPTGGGRPDSPPPEPGEGRNSR